MMHSPSDMTQRPPTDSGDELLIAIIGGDANAASALRLLVDLERITVAAVCHPNRSAPAVRLADELGIDVVGEVSELARYKGLELVLDLSSAHTPSSPGGSPEMIGPRGAAFLRELLLAKKRGDEHERVLGELKIAYERIRGQEGRLKLNQEALERANEQLESRLAEIFFTHEFFKALTSYSSVGDVTSLIVDGANGILGAEIAAVYLLDHETWRLELRGSQGRPEESFAQQIPIGETIVGRSFTEGLIQELQVEASNGSAGWYSDPGDVVSQAALQLRTGDTIIGVMLIASASRRELSAAELDRLQVIGNQASLAVQNALLHEELERLSVTDRLTELYNHGYFQQRLEEELGRASRFGHTLSLIMLDIDDFKNFNDTYGHPRGDRVLQAVSQVIRDNLREMDVAARYGGEEFVVVLPETDAEGAAAVAERIRASVAVFGFVGLDTEGPISKTVSVGVATYPDHATTQSALIETADSAMYDAKRDGKNKVSVARG